MLTTKNKATTPLLRISLLQPYPADGMSIIGPDILLAIINPISMSTFCVLSYFGNDDLQRDCKTDQWLLKEVRDTDVADLAESFCTALQLFRHVCCALLFGTAAAWGFKGETGKRFEHRAQIYYDTFTRRGVPFLGGEQAMSFFSGMVRKDGEANKDLFHYSAADKNKRLAASYYITLVTTLAQSTQQTHPLRPGGHIVTPARDMVFGRLSRIEEAAEDTATEPSGSGGQSQPPGASNEEDATDSRTPHKS